MQNTLLKIVYVCEKLYQNTARNRNSFYRLNSQTHFRRVFLKNLGHVRANAPTFPSPLPPKAWEMLKNIRLFINKTSG